MVGVLGAAPPPEIELPTVQLLRPAEGPHVSLTSGATAFSLVFTHTAIQHADAEHIDRNLATSSAMIINLNNGFPHFPQYIVTPKFLIRESIYNP